MQPRTFMYEQMTWPEVREAARAEKVVLIPFGSIEQHGFHLPLDVDIRIAKEVCIRTASVSDHAIVMAPMTFGFETHHMDWPGTIDIEWEVLIKYGLCVTGSLIRHGFRRIIIVNGHGSNTPITEMIARLTAVKHPEALCAGVCWWQLEEVQRVFNALRESPVAAHGEELETSAYLAIDPEAVKMDMAVSDMTFRRSPHVWSDLTGRKPDSTTRNKLMMMEHFSTGSMSGVRGDATKATREKGVAVLEAAVKELVLVIEELRDREILPPVDYHEAEIDSILQALKERGGGLA